MAVNMRVEPIDRDIQFLIDGSLGSQAQSEIFAQFAREQIDAALVQNTKIVGREPRYTVTVDGRKGAALESVRPNGTIVAEFEFIVDILIWISAQLIKASPVKTGRYKKSHILFADGQEVPEGAKVPPANEYVFMNTQPYARKLELGASDQAMDGIYQVVAVLAKQRFGRGVKINFSYRSAFSGKVVGGREGNKSNTRQPVIIVTSRGG